MSLKAKIEAVIYASEEPVTLVQLAGLLGQEAQAELDALESAQTRLLLETGLEDAASAKAAVEPAHDGEAVVNAAPDVPSVPDASLAPDVSPAPDEAKAAARAEKEAARKLREYFREVLAQLVAEYAGPERGLEIREVAGGYRFATKPEYHDAVRGFVKSLKPPLKLTLQALETLAVVAYKQPVTAPEISEVRGVDSGGVLGSLIARKLITTAGRKQVIGRPILYKTTREFLLKFGLRDVAELPSIEEFEKMAGELADSEPMQEEIPMEERSNEKLEQARAGEDSDKASETGGTADEASVDGRIAGLPPNYDVAEDDPSAEDAAIQESST